MVKESFRLRRGLPRVKSLLDVKCHPLGWAPEEAACHPELLKVPGWFDMRQVFFQREGETPNC